MPTVVMAEDHAVVREGLKTLLETEPDFAVVGQAADGDEAVKLVKLLKPDILIVDLVMPKVGGLEVIRQVKSEGSRTQCVVLSMQANEAYVLEALRAGALGYVLKESGIEELIRAVREALAGRRHLSPPLSQRAFEVYLSKTGPDRSMGLEGLTSRELQVARFVAAGLTAANIAKELGISSRTVESHRVSALRKLGVSSSVELKQYVREQERRNGERG